MDMTVLMLLAAMSLVFVLVGIGRVALLLMKNELHPTPFDNVVDEVQREEPRLANSREQAERVVLRRMIIGSVATSLFGLLVSTLALVVYLMTPAEDSGSVWKLLAILAALVLVYVLIRLVTYKVRYDRLYRSKCRAQRSSVTTRV